MKIALVILRSPELSGKLFEGLQNIKNRSDEFEMSRASVINKVDALYQDNISRLEPRIMVRGEQSYLLNNDNAAKIRGLLLAGIRAAVLWKQLGGNKWRLFFGRKKYVATAREFVSRN